MMPLRRRYRSDRMFGIKLLEYIMATDTMHSKEQVRPRTEFQSSVKKYGIDRHSLEREISNQNPLKE